MLSPAASSDSPPPWRSKLLGRTARVDGMVSAAAPALLDAIGSVPAAILAVGGYGRSELFPFSDVDLLFLAGSEEALAAAKEPLSRFLQSLWDQGLRISHSARTLAECCQLNEQNVELHISFLDVRFLCGDEALFQTLAGKLAPFWERHRHTLVRRLAELTRHRHAKFNDTIFHLEPNIKETPGGIRDIHFLHWLSRLSSSGGAIGDTLREAEGARDFLYELRIYLHERAGRDNNLLTFELQDDAARDLGLGEAPETWMRRYFSFARQTSQSAQRALEFTDSLERSLVRQFRDRRSRLTNADYSVLNDRIFLRNPPEITESAAAVMRLFIFSARHGLRLSWDTQRRLRGQNAAISGHFSAQPAQWPLWSELLSQPHSGVALHEMQETGILNAALPEWNAIDSLVVRDFYHRYTVDEHTLVAIGVVDELSRASSAESHRMQALLAEIDSPALLRLALLLHDIGKGVDPGHHVRGSLAVSLNAMRRIGVPPAGQRTVQFLVEHHLDLSLIMNGRDPDDPATARSLAAQAQTLEYLRYLALLTYADISAVNPTAMTPWRLEQLWRVYSMGQEQLTRELQTDRIHASTNLGFADLPENLSRRPQLARFLQGLPTRYLRTHSPDEVRRHCEVQLDISQKLVAVEIVPREGAYQATVLTLDQPGVFARICGALASFGMNIVKAEAFNNDSGLALDQFRFTDPVRSLELNPSEVERLRKTVERVVLGNDDVRMLLKARRLPLRRPRVTHIAPAVRFNNEASDSATLIEFIGEDRPGLLYDLASVLSAANCDIEIVLIDTEAHKAIDVFYVTYAGAKLDSAVQSRLGADLVRAAEGAPAP